MSLTEKAAYERKWGPFPELAKLLDKKQLGVNWTGMSSSSDNTFDRVGRLLEISALVQDHEIIIEQAVKELGEPVSRDLMVLSDALSNVSNGFSEASKLSMQLARTRRIS